jgi:leucyl-tRNA synthetase
MDFDRWTRYWDEHGTHEAGGADDPRERRYVVSMYPYPSGDLHMGHGEVYPIGDAIARFARLRGANVLHPVGWDSFGLPAENAALRRGLDVRAWTYDNIATQAEGLRRLGISVDRRTRLHTSDPEYYRWNQWLFLRMYERGLAYRKEAPVNWCPADRTVLANEQVVRGRCERCGAEVTRRSLTQWFFRITRYARRLLDDMAQLEAGWPADVLTMQRNWIGRAEGAEIPFDVDGEPLRVFTTRPDTLCAATFLAVAPERAGDLCAPEHRAEFEEYRAAAERLSEIDRLSAHRPKTGVFLGRYAVEPLTGARLPVYASDHVMTGAVLGVPAHDDRDRAFAAAHDLPADDRETPADLVARLGSAESYRLRDWLVSRQRYWGTPIPIIHCGRCGEVPVPDDDLPVRLPDDGYDLRPPDGRSPLASATHWVEVTCPACKGEARRDTDTMDTFVDSSWYFLRYPDPSYVDGPADPAGVARWLPVDHYVGGRPHATVHLLYARFMTKVLHDLGLLPFTEPFRRLTTPGQVTMNGKAMSKTLGNVVNLGDQLDSYGPDAVRVTMLFAGPPEDDIDWADVAPAAAVKWLARVERLVSSVGPASAADEGTRRAVHRLVADVTDLMERTRLNVAIARLMELTTLLTRADPADAAVREGAEALVRMLACFAPFTAEECWERLGHEPSVLAAGWPVADPALLTEETVTCVVQVDGRVRDRLPVPPDIDEADLGALALRSDKVRQALGDAEPTRVVVKAPKVVNIVT